MILLPQIPEPTNDLKSIQATVIMLRNAMQTLSLNAQGQPGQMIFGLAGDAKKAAALSAVVNSAGQDATVQFSLSSASGVLIMFSYLGVGASAAGNLVVSIDSQDLLKVPLAISGGNALPQSGFTFAGNLGAGPHTAAVRASTELTGFSIGVVGSAR